MTSSKRTIESPQGRTIEIRRIDDDLIEVKQSFNDYRFFKLVTDKLPYMFMGKTETQYVFETTLKFGSIKTMQALTEYLTYKLEAYEQTTQSDTVAH